jgi:hypothetical protein
VDYRDVHARDREEHRLWSGLLFTLSQAKGKRTNCFFAMHRTDAEIPNPQSNYCAQSPPGAEYGNRSLGFEIRLANADEIVRFRHPIHCLTASDFS